MWQVYRRGQNEIKMKQIKNYNEQKTEFTWWWLWAKALACVPIPLRLAWILVLFFFCPAVKILKMAKSVYTLPVLLKRAKIKYQTPCLCFSNTFVTRRVDESPLIFICTHSRWTADLLSQSYPTGTMVKLVVGGLQVSVWAAFTTLIREKVKYQEDLRHSGVCKFFSYLSKWANREVMCHRCVTRTLNKSSEIQIQLIHNMCYAVLFILLLF